MQHKRHTAMSQKRESLVLTVRIPPTMRTIMNEIVQVDTHTNLSEFVREAIREKIKRDAPHILERAINKEKR